MIFALHQSLVKAQQRRRPATTERTPPGLASRARVTSKWPSNWNTRPALVRLEFGSVSCSLRFASARRGGSFLRSAYGAAFHNRPTTESAGKHNPPSPPLTQIPGHIDDYDSVRPLRQQTSRENPGALVVKKILVPLPFDELRQQHRDDAFRVFPLDLQDVVYDRLHHESKR